MKFLSDSFVKLLKKADMGKILRLKPQGKFFLLLTLFGAVMLSAAFRPASLITFGVIPFVGSLLTGSQSNNSADKCVKRESMKKGFL